MEEIAKHEGNFEQYNFSSHLEIEKKCCKNTHQKHKKVSIHLSHPWQTHKKKLFLPSPVDASVLFLSIKKTRVRTLTNCVLLPALTLYLKYICQNVWYVRLIVCNFYQKIFGNVEDTDVWNFRRKWFMWRHFGQWRKNFGFGGTLFTQFWRCKYGFIYHSNVQRTIKDDKIKSIVFTRPHAMKRHKIMSPTLTNRES